jgi:hypothetical protein
MQTEIAILTFAIGIMLLEQDQPLFAGFLMSLMGIQLIQRALKEQTQRQIRD